VTAFTRAVYVSYDGALDPLGASQVVPYMIGLAATTRMTLVTFEKERRWRDDGRRRAMEARLAAAGITWRPLRYHARPRLPATAWDIVRGARAIRDAVGGTGDVVVHCRGDVAMAMARAARLPARTRLLYDVRGYFADERAESGSWTRGGLLDRAVRRVEAANLRRADGIVTLTRHARDALAARRRPYPPHRVVPTCVDTESFRPRSAGESPDYLLVYSGSLGGWYLTAEMAAFAVSAAGSKGQRVLFLTPQPELARRAGLHGDWVDVRESAPEEVPAWLRRARAAFFFITPSPAKRASCPTKLGEALACGLPVVVNRGVGDLDDVIPGEGVGVLVDGFDEASYARAAGRLEELLRDPDVAGRCRRVAERRYALAAGVTAYHDLYLELSRGGDHA